MESEARSKTSFDEINKNTGHFERKPTTFRSSISVGGDFSPEKSRYHLYVSFACPWASRCLAVRKLKGLEEVIPVHVVHPVWGVVNTETGNKGWVFSDQELAGIKCDDPLYGCKSLRQLYEIADPHYHGKYTVPVLWDTQKKTIVNNESSEIIRFFNSEFDELATQRHVDLYPSNQRHEIDQLNTWMYDSINNGVYRCGFATTQEAYEEAYRALFVALDEAEDKLSRTRFFGGNQPNEADVRLFVTLVRFDSVYVGHFKCNKKRIVDYPNLWGWLRDTYQWPGISDTVNLTHIKQHYFGSHASINPHLIVPVGPDINFATPHGRERLSKS